MKRIWRFQKYFFALRCRFSVFSAGDRSGFQGSTVWYWKWRTKSRVEGERERERKKTMEVEKISKKI